MDEVVALRAILDNGSEFFFMTWGRLHDSTDPQTLEALVARAGRPMLPSGSKLVTLKVCTTLQEAARAPLFFEAFGSFCVKRSQIGEDYQSWRARTADEMERGRHIYGMGPYDR